jgi:endonuclease/exonuclease/phosphatase family metal-dependent hydrolase
VTVRIANFNVENLFDDFNSGGFGEAELTPPSPQAYEKEVDDTASLLAMLGADLIALAEVENRGVLDKLADKLQEKRPGVTYPERWLITGNDRVRNVALLSTAPLEPSEVVSHRFERFDLEGNLLGPEAGGESYTYARDCLEVGVRYRGYPLTLFAVHFKSKSNDDPQRRLAEARRTRRLVDERFAADPGARLVVLGDFNDTPESVPLRALTEGLVPGAAPLAGGVSLLPPQLAWTHPFGTPNKIIDDQLASPAMAAARDAASITVWHDNDAGFPDGLREVSDHSPVAISYRLGEAPLP